MRQMLKRSMEDEVDTESMVTTAEDTEFARPRSSSTPRSPSSFRSFVQSMVGPRTNRIPSSGWGNVQVWFDLPFVFE